VGQPVAAKMIGKITFEHRGRFRSHLNRDELAELLGTLRLVAAFAHVHGMIAHDDL
jgi:hypothetical protein